VRQDSTILRASTWLLLACGAGRAAAQHVCSVVGPLTPDVHVSQSALYDQIWSQVARGPSAVTIAWSEGQDIWAREFGFDLQPLGPQFWVNDTLYQDVQDEPALCYATGGNFLIAWSERHGYDGQQMGIFARLYDAHAAPLTSEFEVNVIWQASQWRPLIAPTPAGGFVVAWSGNWDGDAFFRVFDGNANPLTSDILVNTFTYDAQVDPAPAVNADGTIFIAFIDYSSHGGVGSGTNIYGRMYDAGANPLQSQEFVLTSWSGNGDQREPRVAADALGRFIVVWEDQLNDGDGYGVMARIYDGAGVPLAPEFQVNTTTHGDQRAPRVAADASGNFIVTYQDGSLGPVRVLGQRFNSAAQRVGAEFVVSQSASGDLANRTIALDAAGGDLLLGYDGPGAPGNGVDVFARRFTLSAAPFEYCAAKPSSLGCVPAIDFSGSPSATQSGPFLIQASNVLNHKFGVLFYGTDSSFTPFDGGTLCVAPPLHRTSGQSSGGNASGSDCSGRLTFDFNTYLHSGADPTIGVGTTLSAQYYFRDPADPAGYGIGLTDALRFTICP
jgi:hypothetical protein